MVYGQYRKLSFLGIWERYLIGKPYPYKIDSTPPPIAKLTTIAIDGVQRDCAIKASGDIECEIWEYRLSLRLWVHKGKKINEM